jgi:Dyp-type peroxidase family
MPQAKGILPRREDREVLYKSPRTCGYFISVKLDPAIDRPRAEAWLNQVSPLIDQLVAREPADPGEEKGEKVAAVAVGFAPTFFLVNGQPRFDPPVEPPACFAADHPMPNATGPLSNVSPIDADVMFYVASVYEARVNEFVSQLAATRPDVQTINIDRGYQRLDETEPFGYKDGLRNIKSSERPRFVFVHREGSEPYEPRWADGGSYMVFMKILQKPDAFAALPDDASRDAVIGRKKGGERLDLAGQGVQPREEPADPITGLPPTSHVGKAGPRGVHDDTQIFRRGLPFMETTTDGQLRVGLEFCSFQASLDQFDVVFNDWVMNRHFPSQANGGEAGADALLDPAGQLTAIEKFGFFFVPPYSEAGLAAAVLPEPRRERGKPTTGRLVVHKRVVDQSDPSRRFERRGFRFQILDSQGQVVPGSEFETDSTGRGICPAELTIGQNYKLNELHSPVPNVELTHTDFTMEHPNQQLHVPNQVTQPNTPYGG